MNCKPGDLAYIVRSGAPENIGAVVEVLRPVPPGEWLFQDSPEWVVKARDKLWGFDSGNPEPYLVDDLETRDCDLRPISGVPVDEETEIEAPA